MFHRNFPMFLIMWTFSHSIGCRSGDPSSPFLAANRAPEVAAFAVRPSTQVLPGDTVSLDVQISDAEGESVTVSWSAPAGSFTRPDSPQTDFIVPEDFGPLELTLHLRDASGEESLFSTILQVGYLAQNDADGDSIRWDEGDCNDLDPAINPDALEVVDGHDNNCNGWIDEGSTISDDDGDHWSELDGDCNDESSLMYPYNQELIDGLDNDCNGLVDDATTLSDDDADGVNEIEGDCADDRADVFPGAVEIADMIDNNCDGYIDENTVARDDDGDGYSENDGDCDDADETTFPGAEDIADNRDNNCDGLIDEGSRDTDDDGDGFSEAGGDCNDMNYNINPDATETVDGQDNNCNLVVDESTSISDDDFDGIAEAAGDCDDANATIYPDAVEMNDGIDNDCNGLIDDSETTTDDDGDTFSTATDDCNDNDASIYPGAIEAADWKDNDCDGIIDESTVWYDDDNDGFSELDGDCNDNDNSTYPGAIEWDDNIDQNCDGNGGENATPVAIIEFTSPGVTCDLIELDANLSYDSDGDPIQAYYWYVVSIPTSSAVTNTWISENTSAIASLATDLAGTYRIGLIVSDGISSSPPTEIDISVVDRTYNDDPVATISDDQTKVSEVTCFFESGTWKCPECPSWKTQVDGSQSSDPDGDRLFFDWEVSSSTASLCILSGNESESPEVEIKAPIAEYGRTNTVSVMLKMTVTDCFSEKDVDTVLLTYSCVGK